MCVCLFPTYADCEKKKHVPRHPNNLDVVPIRQGVDLEADLGRMMQDAFFIMFAEFAVTLSPISSGYGWAMFWLGTCLQPETEQF